jgi:nicotinamidase-related amidase
MTGITELPIPPHFDQEMVGKIWRVPYQERAIEAAEWAHRHDIVPAGKDGFKICLVAIDCQNTFCIPEFELFVGGRSGAGAVEDNVRLCTFIYRNLGAITRIVSTVDTHLATQIFHPVFWIDENNNHPEPMTVISPADIDNKLWRVNPGIMDVLDFGDLEEFEDYARHYVEQLHERGKYELTIWPYHAMLGGIGHALVSSVEEALFFHNLARHSQTGFEIKGDNPKTENYSVLSPEVLTGPSGRPVDEKNVGLLNKLLEYDAVVIAGQAKSHCLAWTVEDLLAEILPKDEQLASKVYLLEDCTSPVVVPGIVDFTEQADDAFDRFRQAGMHVVKSTDPMESWPGIRLSQ